MALPACSSVCCICFLRQAGEPLCNRQSSLRGNLRYGPCGRAVGPRLPPGRALRSAFAHPPCFKPPWRLVFQLVLKNIAVSFDISERSLIQSICFRFSSFSFSYFSITGRFARGSEGTCWIVAILLKNSCSVVTPPGEDWLDNRFARGLQALFSTSFEVSKTLISSNLGSFCQAASTLLPGGASAAVRPVFLTCLCFQRTSRGLRESRPKNQFPRVAQAFF